MPLLCCFIPIAFIIILNHEIILEGLQYCIFIYKVLMNRFFGFLKEKFIQAKQQNKQDLETLANAVAQVPPSIISDSYEYNSQKMQQRLLQMKNNYAKWNVYIANQASTGLYYTQTHNRGVILKKIESNKSTNQSIQRLKIITDQMQRTLQQVKQLNTLSSNWVKKVINRTQNLLKLQCESQRGKFQSKQRQQVAQNADLNQISAQYDMCSQEKIEEVITEIKSIVVQQLIAKDGQQNNEREQQHKNEEQTASFNFSSPN